LAYKKWRKEIDMSYTNNSSTQSQKSGVGCLRVIVILLVIVGIYKTVQFFIDKNNYSQGHQAYLQANCELAIKYFDKTLSWWKFIEFGDFYSLTRQERFQCVDLKEAEDKQKTDPSLAIVGYYYFTKNHKDSPLAQEASNRVESIFLQTDIDTLATEVLCDKIETLEAENYIPQKSTILPNLLYKCGQIYEEVPNYVRVFQMYEKFLFEYPKHSLAASVKDSLAQAIVTDARASDNPSMVILAYLDFITKYGASPFVAEALIRIESIFLQTDIDTLATEALCDKIETLETESYIPQKNTIFPNLLYKCGQTYEEIKNYANAFSMYEKFLSEYPRHSLAASVKDSLARAIVADARASGAGIIPAPERSGSTSGESTVVIIQNDSPNRLRIVFSGPDSRIEELAACNSCQTYSLFGPLYCPEKGPIGRYTLPSGEYDVVVQSISDSGVTPWAGNWELKGGDEYYNCFFVIVTTSP
jgi:tetratricopeptide (TPR) repeat protein